MFPNHFDFSVRGRRVESSRNIWRFRTNLIFCSRTFHFSRRRQTFHKWICKVSGVNFVPRIKLSEFETRNFETSNFNLIARVQSLTTTRFPPQKSKSVLINLCWVISNFFELRRGKLCRSPTGWKLWACELKVAKFSIRLFPKFEQSETQKLGRGNKLWRLQSESYESILLFVAMKSNNYWPIQKMMRPRSSIGTRSTYLDKSANVWYFCEKWDRMIHLFLNLDKLAIICEKCVCPWLADFFCASRESAE